MKLSTVAMAVALVVSLVVVPGCSSTPSEPASKTTTTTPTAAVSTPPTKDELYKEARKVYEGIRAEQTKLQYAGGADELPPSMLAYVTGQLAVDFAALFRSWKEDGDVLLGPSSRVVWVRPHDEVMEGSLVSLAACADATKSRVKHADGSVSSGAVAVNYFYFKYFDGELKAFQSGDEWVGKC